MMRLVSTMKKREETEAQAKRVAALREYARLSRFKFDNGYPGYSAPTWFVDHGDGPT